MADLKEIIKREYIDREATIDALDCRDEYDDLVKTIREQPAADVRPTTRKPIKISEDEFCVQGYLVNEKYYCCPNCSKVFGNLRAHNVRELINEYKFCNECGQELDWGLK